jgi:hypothetical protein
MAARLARAVLPPPHLSGAILFVWRPRCGHPCSARACRLLRRRGFSLGRVGLLFTMSRVRSPHSQRSRLGHGRTIFDGTMLHDL